MKIVYLPHARTRMKERSIGEREVQDTILAPEKVLREIRFDGRYVAKRVMMIKGKQVLLLVIYEQSSTIITVVTVIGTSKIKKYF